MAVPPARRHEVAVELVAPETKGVFSVHLSAPPGFAYAAGQHVLLRIAQVQDSRGSQRSFTLSSSPTELPRLSITTREGESPFKRAMRALRTGDRLEFTGPLGTFTLDASRPAMMVAGGIGVTPFRSMIRWAADTKSGRGIRLLHSVTDPNAIPFRGELAALSGTGGDLRLEYTVTGDDTVARGWTGRRGRISGEMLSEDLHALDRPKVYVCGPPAMVRGTRDLLVGPLALPPADVRIESFSGY